MAGVALLSNPRSTGNRAILPRVRAYCAANPDIFHYEVESVDQIGASRAQSLNNSSPVITVLLAVLLLGEPLSPPDLFDALTVDAALAIRDSRAEELVDLALTRLISAFPELQP